MKIGVNKQYQPRQGEQAAVRSPVIAKPGQQSAAGKVMGMQRTAGNQAVQRMLQPKLTISEPGDRYEQEADRLAEQVMTMPSRPDITRAPIQISRFSGHPADKGVMDVPPSVEKVLASSGRPLEPAVREDMEQRFGYDFSGVRIHTDETAVQSAKEMIANAYTVNNHLVFGKGHFLPETYNGKKLLAHELTHFIQQKGNAYKRTDSLLQYQKCTKPSQLKTNESPHRENKNKSSYRIRVIAHASPRWKVALNINDEEQQNFKLSKLRADAVVREINKILVGYPEIDTCISIDKNIEHYDGSVSIGVSPKGRKETLKEAKGNRYDNALTRRRVDVVIDSNQLISGIAGISVPPSYKSTNSKFWHVSVDVSAGASIGMAGTILALKLTNDESGATMEGYVRAVGVGPKASIGASHSIWSDPVGFSTDKPINFKDFNKINVRYSTIGLSLFLGYEISYISFNGLGKHAQTIDVGGWNAGTAGGVGGAVVWGELYLNGWYPPSLLKIKDSDMGEDSYQRNEKYRNTHRVLFSTGSSNIDGSELALFDSFIKGVLTRR